ncbi:unnamed protein product, partial [Didymodactylos carnosus]
MGPHRKFKNLFIDISSIIIDLTNLGEHFYIYFLTHQANLNKHDERIFFYILFAIGTIFILESLTLNPRLRLLISLIIEIGELFSYLLVFKGTLFGINISYFGIDEHSLILKSNTLTLVAYIFFIFEALLLIISFFLIDPEHKKRMWTIRLCGVICRLFLYIILNLNQIFFLFLNSQSPYHKIYFEILTTLSFFLGALCVDVSLDMKNKFLNENDNNDIKMG